LRRPSLRSQLNQIRLWVRQGRTDAWIAHKLDISVEELERFKRDQHLTGDPAPAPEPSVDLFPSRTEEVEPDLEDLEERGAPEADEEPEEPEPEEAVAEEGEREEAVAEGAASDTDGARRRRRGRRGGRRRRVRSTSSFEGTFDHGGEGYGLWLDPAVVDSDVYTEHWAGHREVTITVEPDAITIRRAPSD
jgi:hypothetical protein